MTDLVPMSVKGLMLDPISNSPIVVLRDEKDQIFLPIWVGIFEANAIALQLENVETPRPMTHDLLRTVLDTLEAKVTRVVINDLRESTFFARIFLTNTTTDHEIDARPSDAIALALRVSAPIFVHQSVLDQAQTLSPEDTQEEKMKKWLEQATTDDLGKYKM
ncbi:MAG TPA: bifunctional nuclease family protein [Thermoanaerobaculia bacterium]|nr:bifunctional nuclease family protein [Thermoanaerobaculia bacterium]